MDLSLPPPGYPMLNPGAPQVPPVTMTLGGMVDEATEAEYLARNQWVDIPWVKVQYIYIHTVHKYTNRKHKQIPKYRVIVTKISHFIVYFMKNKFKFLDNVTVIAWNPFEVLAHYAMTKSYLKNKNAHACMYSAIKNKMSLS